MELFLLLFWFHSYFLNLFLWFKLFFIVCLIYYFLGEGSGLFYFGWRRLNFHLFFSLMGRRSMDIFFVLVFLLIIILNVKELFSLVEVVLFNFILSDRSFMFKWSWISYYICFLRWRWGEDFSTFPLVRADWLWSNLLFLRIVLHWFRVCGIVFLLYCIFLFLLLLHKGQLDPGYFSLGVLFTK